LAELQVIVTGASTRALVALALSVVGAFTATAAMVAAYNVFAPVPHFRVKTYVPAAEGDGVADPVGETVTPAVFDDEPSMYVQGPTLADHTMLVSGSPVVSDEPSVEYIWMRGTGT
jgi:hypothetical protein